MSGSPKLVRGPGSLCYRLRVSRRRRSVGLTITDTGDLVVHAPPGLSLEVIHRIITQNRTWIEKKQEKCREALGRLEPGKVYYLGNAFRVQVIPQGSMGIRLAQDVLRLNLENSQADPWPQLLGWYRREAVNLLTDKVSYFAPRLGLAPPRLEVRDWRRRWGECRGDGSLRFNWRLVLLPPEIMDYVVVHELTHLLVSGHSRDFWRHVGRCLPDFAERRRWLRIYGAPFLFWKFDL